MRAVLITVFLGSILGFCVADPVVARAPTSTSCLYVQATYHPGYRCGVEGNVKKPAVLVNAPSGSSASRTVENCRAFCAKHPRCVSFAVDSGDHICTLYSKSFVQMGGIDEVRNNLYNYNVQGCFKLCCYNLPQPAIIVNGGFEQPGCNTDDGDHEKPWTFPKGDLGVFVGAYNIDEGFDQIPGYQTHSGSYFVDIYSTSAPGYDHQPYFSQVINATAPGSYELTYYYLIIEQDAYTNLTVTVDGVPVDALSLPPQNDFDTSYTKRVVPVTIQNASPTLKILYSAGRRFGDPTSQNNTNEMLLDDFSMIVN